MIEHHDSFTPFITQDGTLTFFSKEYQQTYHSVVGAKKETYEKFIVPSGILNHQNPRLLDIGFGLGYNALSAFMELKTGHIVSLEKDPQTLDLAFKAHSESQDLLRILRDLKKEGGYSEAQKSITIIIKDALSQVEEFKKSPPKPLFTHVFLDAFSVSYNPELWTLQFFKDLYDLLDKEGLVVTYSSALPVMKAFLKAGFFLEYTDPVGRKRPGLIAYKNPNRVQKGLSYEDLFLLQYSVRSLPNINKGGFTQQQIANYRYKLSQIALRLGYAYPHKRVLNALKSPQHKESFINENAKSRS